MVKVSVFSSCRAETTVHSARRFDRLAPAGVPSSTLDQRPSSAGQSWRRRSRVLDMWRKRWLGLALRRAADPSTALSSTQPIQAPWELASSLRVSPLPASFSRGGFDRTQRLLAGTDLRRQGHESLRFQPALLGSCVFRPRQPLCTPSDRVDAASLGSLLVYPCKRGREFPSGQDLSRSRVSQACLKFHKGF